MGMKNKRGWIKILEAFLAILLIAAVSLIVLNKMQQEDLGVYSKITDLEILMLREIELNSTLRSEVLATTGETDWDNFPTLTQNRIGVKTPSFLDCRAKICLTNTVCQLQNPNEKNVYAKTALISSEGSVFNPKVLKIFCWEK